MNPADPFPPTPLFAFPVYSTTVAGFDEHREGLLAEIFELKRRYPGVVRSNRNAWHSGPEFFEHKNEHVAWALQKVSKFARLALARTNQNWANSELKLVSAWANVLGNGGWNAPHHHFPCHWSGTIYVQADNFGTTPGEPDGCFELLNPTPWLSAIGQGGNLIIGPKRGLTLLFPSSIYHFVHPHFDDRERVSIAFNYTVVPKTNR